MVVVRAEEKGRPRLARKHPYCALLARLQRNRSARISTHEPTLALELIRAESIIWPWNFYFRYRPDVQFRMAEKRSFVVRQLSRGVKIIYPSCINMLRKREEFITTFIFPWIDAIITIMFFSYIKNVIIDKFLIFNINHDKILIWLLAVSDIILLQVEVIYKSYMQSIIAIA